MTTRIFLKLEYDGAPFCGWQRQLGCLSVQGVLEQALHPLCGHKVTVIGAGRTDAGVHALGQVAHFDADSARPAQVYVRALNATTPPALAILAATPVPAGFHARYSAIYREYRYRLLDRPVPSALERGRVWHVGRALDVAAMSEASQCLLGNHDFSAFRAASCQARSPIREVSRMAIQRVGEEIWITIGANGFLHHMVRTIAGCLVQVGSGNWSKERLAQVLHQRERRLAAPTAIPQGLYLAQVTYDPSPWEGHDFVSSSG